jgi:hypothetical protein
VTEEDEDEMRSAGKGWMDTSFSMVSSTVEADDDAEEEEEEEEEEDACSSVNQST